MVVSEEFIKEAERNKAERDKFKSESEAKSEVISSQAAQIAALRGLLDVEKLISKDWKESALARKDVILTDDQLILTYDKRIAELQNERDSARKNNFVWGAIGLVLGAAAVLAGQRK